jgi:hypothetical protein
MPGPEASDSDLKILRLVALRPEPFATARDLEPDMDVGRRQTRNRLDDLHHGGFLRRTKVGGTKVYWLSDQGKNELPESR